MFQESTTIYRLILDLVGCIGNRNHSTPYLPILPILCIYYNSGFNVCFSFVLISGIRSFLMAGIVNPQVLLGAAFRLTFGSLRIRPRWQLHGPRAKSFRTSEDIPLNWEFHQETYRFKLGMTFRPVSVVIAWSSRNIENHKKHRFLIFDEIRKSIKKLWFLRIT